MPDQATRSRTLVFNDAGDSVAITSDLATQAELDASYTAAVAAAASAQSTIRSASTKGFINHGSTANTARPTGYASVEWFGTVEPTNAVDGDTWVGSA